MMVVSFAVSSSDAGFDCTIPVIVAALLGWTKKSQDSYESLY